MRRPYPKNVQPVNWREDAMLRVRALVNPDLTIEQRITDIVQREIDEFRVDTEQDLIVFHAFRAALETPYPITINTQSDVRMTGWAITQSRGDCRVVFLPYAGLFALCTESENGPLEIGIQGSAIGCFRSV